MNETTPDDASTGTSDSFIDVPDDLQTAFTETVVGVNVSTRRM